jgi:pimeloyl-ACP methyl ester carboxylesterase
MSLASWETLGRRVEVLGRRVFVVERGAGPDVLAILHGFPSFSGDFCLVLDALAQRFRVVVHDHLGFGLSDKPRDYSYSLVEQAEVAVAVWRSLGLTRVHLLAHDYGTSVATEIVARRERAQLPVELASLTLTNGSVHLELAKLRLSQRLLRSPITGPTYARLASRGLFLRRMRAILAKPVADEHLDAMWDALVREGGRELLPRISTYLDERRRFAGRWIGALTRLDIPAHVLWAERDPIAVPAIADQLAKEIPGAVNTRLPGLGHYPMLEDADAFARAALALFERAR